VRRQQKVKPKNQGMDADWNLQSLVSK
jgi:hypothetical protein